MDGMRRGLTFSPKPAIARTMTSYGETVRTQTQVVLRHTAESRPRQPTLSWSSEVVTESSWLLTSTLLEVISNLLRDEGLLNV